MIGITAIIIIIFILVILPELQPSPFTFDDFEADQNATVEISNDTMELSTLDRYSASGTIQIGYPTKATSQEISISFRATYEPKTTMLGYINFMNIFDEIAVSILLSNQIYLKVGYSAQVVLGPNAGTEIRIISNATGIFVNNHQLPPSTIQTMSIRIQYATLTIENMRVSETLTSI